MEAFEHVVKVFFEARGYAVTANVKFPVRRRTRKKERVEYQTHGYEVDLVCARADELLLASVKSFFGSTGVWRQGFRGLADESRRTHFDRYRYFNDADLRKKIRSSAAQTYGYDVKDVRFALCVGKFKPGDEEPIRLHLARQKTDVYGLDQMLETLLMVAESKTYIDDPVVMTMKVLRHAGRLAPPDD